jgi:hypothetical protein
MTEDLIFQEPEPVKFDARALKAGIEFETKEHIGWRLTKERYDKFNSVPKAKRQEILECFRGGGITIGQVAEKFGIDSEIVGNIVYLNIAQASYLRNDTL